MPSAPLPPPLQTGQTSGPSAALKRAKTLSQRDFIGFLLCAPFFGMLGLLVVEATLAALTTWLVIQAGRDLANEDFLIADFGWIVLAQSTSYVVGAVSWVYAERAGFGAFGRYMLRFARENRSDAQLFGNTAQREKVEPFLTNETFHLFFELVYELEADLKLFFNLIFNAAVLGYAIDSGLPVVYGLVFGLLLTLQISVRKWLSEAYAENQRATNRMTARTYTAWDNITSGNRYNFRIWHAGFKTRLREALKAQIRSIMAREGIAAIGGIFALVVVFAYLAYVAGASKGDAALLIALAATLPRQIDMSYNVHGLASGWNDLLAVWTRMAGACNAMHAQADADFASRINIPQLQLTYTPPAAPAGAGTTRHPAAQVLLFDSVESASAQLRSLPCGTVQVRGSNGSGKSTLLAALKHQLGSSAYYWPTSTKLAFDFAAAQSAALEDTLAEQGDDMDVEAALNDSNLGATDPGNAEPSTAADHAAARNAVQPSALANKRHSSGEKQLASLAEIAAQTRAPIYLLDEWDANLDAHNRAVAQRLIDQLAARSLVVEISHRV